MNPEDAKATLDKLNEKLEVIERLATVEAKIEVLFWLQTSSVIAIILDLIWRSLFHV